MTIEDVVDSAAQLTNTSEPEPRYGSVPRYHAHLGPSGTSQTKASESVRPESRLPTQNMKSPFVGLSRKHLSGSLRRDGLESDTLSSDMYVTDAETYRERPPHNGHGDFLSPEIVLPPVDAFEISSDKWHAYPAASAAKRYISNSLESKRSARDILAMLGEEVACSTHLPKSQQPEQKQVDISQGTNSWHTVEKVRPTLCAIEIPTSMCCEEVDDLGFSTSVSTDWAPVVPAAKKQRLSGKGPLKIPACNINSEYYSPTPAIPASAHEKSFNASPLLRSKNPISNSAGHAGKRIIQRNTDPLNFPTAEECAAPVLRRCIVVPATFPSWHEYARLFTAAVHEEINLRVREMALMFYKVCQVS